MERKRCIWATSQPWRSQFRVSAHHYARCLVERGWDVVFLSHPVSPLHFLHAQSRAITHDRIRNWWAGGQEDLEGHLFHYAPMTLLPPHDAPILRSGRVLDLWPRATVPSLRKRLALRGFETVDLLVLDTERYGFLLDAVSARTSVLRLVDSLDGFARTAPAWIDRSRSLQRRVDHVVVTSRVLEDEARDAGARSVTYVPNGVEVEHFTQNTAGPPAEYATIAAPRAVYVGAIETWFDTTLVRAVASALPEVAFVLIGPGGENLDALRPLSNVHVLGHRPYDALPAYLANADVGIIPFRSTRLTRSINPIKLYEYMACGLPVVATAWEELERLGSPAVLCRTADEFVRGIAEVTERDVDRRVLLEFAKRSDWRVRASCLLDAIGRGA